MEQVAAAASHQDPGQVEPHRHLLIAGTGRAGTSFLVRYLGALGLDTHLGRQGDADWDEAANAGLEDMPFPGISFADLPYVVKTPWLHECVDEILARPEFQVDAVIVPVRPLDEAAASRVVVERRALHERFPWMIEMERTWDHSGGAAGGSVFSLHALDQARVLAVSFHHLIERLVRADVPLVLLDFPRLVLDPDYLFGKLAPILPSRPGMTRELARGIHRNLADASKIRIDAELDRAASSVATDDGATRSSAVLDRIAIRRELARLRGLLAERAEEMMSAVSERDALRAELVTLAANNERLPAEPTRPFGSAVRRHLRALGKLLWRRRRVNSRAARFWW